MVALKMVTRCADQSRLFANKQRYEWCLESPVATCRIAMLGNRELPHHAAILVFKDVTVIHEGRGFIGLVIETHQHF